MGKENITIEEELMIIQNKEIFMIFKSLLSESNDFLTNIVLDIKLNIKNKERDNNSSKKWKKLTFFHFFLQNLGEF